MRFLKLTYVVRGYGNLWMGREGEIRNKIKKKKVIVERRKSRSWLEYKINHLQSRDFGERGGGGGHYISRAKLTRYIYNAVSYTSREKLSTVKVRFVKSFLTFFKFTKIKHFDVIKILRHAKQPSWIYLTTKILLFQLQNKIHMWLTGKKLSSLFNIVKFFSCFVG